MSESCAERTKGFLDSMRSLLLLSATYLLSFGSNIASAAPLCTGYDKTQERWGLIQTTELLPDANCPANFALVGHRPISRKIDQIDRGTRFAKGTIMGSCCPMLPDALTDVTTYSDSGCPAGYVATGLRSVPAGPVKDGAAATSWLHTLRCSKINTEKYTYAPATTLLLTGVPAFSLTGWMSSMRHGTRDQLPPSLRYGMGRTSRTLLEYDFCVGYPWGSALQEFGKRGCEGSRFYELVPRFPAEVREPECRAVENPFSPLAHCIYEERH